VEDSSLTFNLPPFTPFPSISRLSRECVVTEKLDGTNAQVHVTEDGRVLAGSRNRWITPEDDNYGFAKWVQAHEEDLRTLGPGSHFGEWWGNGIQRRYGLAEKRFSLFNVGRWEHERPACCGVVPILYRGDFCTARINGALTLLGAAGSVAAPGFKDPEGIVIYHTKSQTLFKKTLDKNDEHKSAL